MRILHVVPSYIPAWRYGGPIRSVHGLCRAQAQRGHHVSVATTNADGPARLNEASGVPVDRDGVEVRYFSLSAPARLFRAPALRDWLRGAISAFDVVHLHSVFLWPTLVAARVAARARRPYVVSPRGMLSPELIARRGRLRKRLWISLFERRTLAASAGIVATSALETADIRALGLGLAPIAEIPNGVDLEEFDVGRAAEPSRGIAEAIGGGAYALCLGRVSWKKRLDVAIGAVSRMEGARLIVAGPDDEGLAPRLESLARDLGIADRVVFLAEVGGADRVALLRGARVAWLPSASENFGNAILEALACGVPAVVSREVGLAGAIAAAGAGAVVAADEESFARASKGYFLEPESARNAGRRGRRMAEAHYGWDAVVDRTIAMYQGALGA